MLKWLTESVAYWKLFEVDEKNQSKKNKKTVIKMSSAQKQIKTRLMPNIQRKNINPPS